MSLTNTLEHVEQDRSAIDLEILASFDEGQEEGEPSFVVELIDLYLEEAPRIFATVREGLATCDFVTAKRAAHSLRGSSSNLGILQMAAIAGELEQLAAKHELVAAQLLLVLENEFDRVQQILLGERQKRLA